MNNSKIAAVFPYMLTRFYYAHKFFHIGRRTVIFSPLKFSETGTVFIGNKTVIANQAWLMGNQKETGITLRIGNEVRIGHFAHIIARKKVVIEDNVLIADRVYITDCNHKYQNVNLPIMLQDISIEGTVRIGADSWLGENVCVIGAKIGRHCVIGANAVVNRDIPDYSVAVGIPAKVVKKYNHVTGEWEKTC